MPASQPQPAADHPFELAVVIGRFQPFHCGHAALLARALACAPRVAVVFGSAFQRRSARNPFTWEERAAMIGATLDEAARERVRDLPVRDYYDDLRWRDAVQRTVRSAEPAGRVALVGHGQGAAKDYLRGFPDWQLVEIACREGIDATSVRRIWFEGEDAAATAALLGGLVPPQVAHYLAGWAGLPAFAALREEHRAVEEAKRRWGTGPFVTVDAVVSCAGHVLLVRRGRHPGKGAWALPGGFLDGRERLLAGAMRELREETGIAVGEGELRDALVGTAVFDHPERSQRGRTITHAHHFALERPNLPEVHGADDAEAACWVPLAALAGMEERLFEDHFHILDHFLGIVPQAAASP